MFLATLDENISKQVLDTLYEANIQVTTTKNNKEKYFKDNDRILTFEELIDICKGNVNKWEFYNYSNEQVKQATDLIKTQLDKHQGHDFVKKALNKRLTAYSRLLSNK